MVPHQGPSNFIKLTAIKCKHIEEIEFVSEFFLPTNLVDTMEQNNLMDGILSSLPENCEDIAPAELLYRKADVEASNFPSVAVSESFFDFSNGGFNLVETIQNNSLETDESHERVTPTECELSEPEEQNDQTHEELVLLRAIRQHSSNGGLNSNEKITVETDEGSELVAEMHDSQQGNSINRQKRTDTQQTKYTSKPRKTTSVVWEFFDKVEKKGEVRAKCKACSKELCGNSRKGTSSLHKHRCFKDWKKDAKQQPVSNVESITKVNSKTKALQTNGADSPPQAKRSKMVAKVGQREEDKEREEETSTDSIVNVMAEVQNPFVPDISQAADSGLVHDQVQDDYTTKETLGRSLKDQEHRLSSHHIIELLPTETQSSGRQANNMAIDGTGGLPQVGCTQIEDGSVAIGTTSSIRNFPVFSPTSELRSFLSQSPQVLLSPAESDRFCSLLNTAINAASNERVKNSMREVLDEIHRLKEAFATCPSSSQSDTLPQQGYENLASKISQSAKLPYNSEAEITSLDDQAAQLERELKTIYENRERKKIELFLLENEALQNIQATAIRIKIRYLINLFELVKSVLPE